MAENSLSLRKLNFTPATFAPTMWTPKERKVTILEDAARRDEAILNQIKGEHDYQKQFGAFRDQLNPAEDEWLRDKYNQHQQQVDKMLAVGDYTKAMQYSMRQVGQLLNDPGMKARIKANAAYKQFVADTQRRNDIGQDVKDWAIAMNPYHYEDKIDASGQVIGGTDWKPTITPVEEVDLFSLAKDARSMLTPKTGSINDVQFVDAEGNFTDDIRQAADVAVQKSGSWVYLGEKELRGALMGAIEMRKDAKASLDQDYEVAKWKYNNLPDDQKDSMVGKDIIGENGRMLTREEYFQKRIAPWLKESQINNRSVSVSYGSGLAKRAEIKAQRNLAMQNYIAQQTGYAGYYGTSANITYDNTDDYIAAKGEVNNAVNNLIRAMPALAGTEKFKNFVKTGDYDGLINYINKIPTKDGKLYRDVINSYNKRLVTKAIDAINNNKGWLSATKNNVSKQQLDDIE